MSHKEQVKEILKEYLAFENLFVIPYWQFALGKKEITLDELTDNELAILAREYIQCEECPICDDCKWNLHPKVCEEKFYNYITTEDDE